MTEKEKDNIYYVCTLLEYLSRKTHNDRKTIIEYFSKQDVEHLLYVAVAGQEFWQKKTR